MSDDQRMARDTAEPPKSGGSGGERWADYMAWLRSTMSAAVLDLHHEAQRTPRVPSGWTPLELLSHVLHMEQRWFVWGFLGEPVDHPWGDWDVPDPTTQEGRWRVPAETTAEALAARLRGIGERTSAILRQHPLDTPARTGGRFTDDPPTLEWICFHVLAEYARHAGHLDIVVELDGA